MLLEHLLGYTLTFAATVLWAQEGTEQLSKPLMSIFQWHFMQKGLYYVVAAPRQLRQV